MQTVVEKIRACQQCKGLLPLGPRPVIRISPSARVVIIGQAPGRRVHETGIPWNDPSGNKLREWLNVDKGAFYDETLFSFFSMSFCYPGKGASGDLPPRTECAPLWHPQAFAFISTKPLVLLVGQFAQAYYLKRSYKGSVTETVRSFKEYLPAYFPLPHPSPRNQSWLKTNSWFMNEVIPELQHAVKAALTNTE